jgi:hypothetical protein
VIEDRLPLHNKKRAAIRRPHMQSARKTKGARSLAAIITSYNRLSSSRGDIKSAAPTCQNAVPWKQGRLCHANRYIAQFSKETISMRPFSAAPARSACPASPGDDLDATVSFSGSEDEQPDPPGLQQLARALLAWEPTLVTAYARLGHSQVELAPFAAFLVQLDREVDGRTAARGEIVGWLQTLATDDAARSRAFRIASGLNGAVTALASYQAIRMASQ